ncbi:MAG: hypothetical protein IT163_13170 [Bryobacterales bacterium]|nr:hypothetical protein [Bryobacterales bacterium]
MGALYRVAGRQQGRRCKALAFPLQPGENLPMLKTMLAALVMMALPALAADISVPG